MNKFIQNTEAAFVRYLRHVLKNGSFHPLTTLLFITAIVTSATSLDRINLIHAVALELFACLVLLYFADRRDQRIANRSFEVQLEAVRALVADSAEMASAVATARSDNQERSMHAQDISIAHITTNTEKEG